jgi:hypothetical protein
MIQLLVLNNLNILTSTSCDDDILIHDDDAISGSKYFKITLK